MVIKLTNFRKYNNDLNRNVDTSDWHEIEGELRVATSIINPQFILSKNDDIINYNYIYVPIWKRYYFIGNIIFENNRVRIECTEDYLNSFATEILNSELYCIRSYSDFDENITDTLFPAQNETKQKSITINNLWTSITGGYYVIAIASGGDSTEHIGANAYYILNQNQMSDFMADLMNVSSISLSGLGENMVKAMVNPLQYLRSCFWLPFKPDCETETVSEISFGFWSSSASAQTIVFNDNADTYTNINAVFSNTKDLFDSEYNFLNYEPYSSVTLTMYPFGVFSFPRPITTHLVNGEDLYIKLYCDNLTGACNMIITCGNDDTPLMVNTVQLGVEIPIGEILRNYAAGLLDLGSTITSTLSGNVIGAASGIFNAIDAITPNATINGAVGGFAQLMLDDKWTLTRYYYDVNIDREFLGLPCCKNVTVEDLTGYAQFSNVAVNIYGMTETENSAIVSLLESGIFIDGEIM